MIPYPDLSPVIFKIWKFEVRWYGVMYIIGFIAAYFVIKYLAARKKVRLLGDDLWDFMFYAMIGVIVGGRLGYCLFYAPAYYFLNPLKIFAIWEGGMSFHGGLIGVFIGTLYYCWKKKVHFYDAADIIVASAPIGIGLGRLGNFINGELFGRATDAVWCMIFPHGGDVCRHPSQLYESLLEGLLLFAILFIMNIKKVRRGIPMWSFIFFYGLFRFICEFFREPDPHLGLILGPFTMGQLLTFPMIILGGIMIGYILLKKDSPKKRKVS